MPGGFGKGAREGPQKRRQVFDFLFRQPDRLAFTVAGATAGKFGVPNERGWCLHIVRNGLLERCKLPGVHVRWPQSHTAQTRCLEGPFHGGIIGHHETKFLTLFRFCVAEKPQAIEFIFLDQGYCGGSTAIRSGWTAQRNGRVVKMLIGEEGTVVAAHALPFADERTQAVDFLGCQNLLTTWIAPDSGLDVAIKA